MVDMGKANTDLNRAKTWELPSMRALGSDRQRRFVLEYLKDMNGAQAAKRSGYSPKCARQQAWDLLTRPDIRAALEVARSDFSNRLECTVESVLQRLLDLSFEAREARQYSAAVGSLALLGKHLGIFDKHGSDSGRAGRAAVPEEVVDQDNRTDAERLQEFADDIRILADQRQQMNVSVEEFIHGIEMLAASTP
jgi:phage terminase small subunit